MSLAVSAGAVAMPWELVVTVSAPSPPAKLALGAGARRREHDVGERHRAAPCVDDRGLEGIGKRRADLGQLRGAGGHLDPGKRARAAGGSRSNIGERKESSCHTETG